MTWIDWALLVVLVAVVLRWWHQDRQDFEEGKSRKAWNDYRHQQTPEEARRRWEELKDRDDS